MERGARPIILNLDIVFWSLLLVFDYLFWCLDITITSSLFIMYEIESLLALASPHTSLPMTLGHTSSEGRLEVEVGKSSSSVRLNHN
jgi:hypothetical protein